jgi:hypothetical protein
VLDKADETADKAKSTLLTRCGSGFRIATVQDIITFHGGGEATRVGTA